MQGRIFVSARAKGTRYGQRWPQVAIALLVILGGLLISYSKFYPKPQAAVPPLSALELHHSTLDFLKEHAKKCSSRKYATNSQLSFHLKHKFGVNQKNLPTFEQYFGEAVESLKKEGVAGSVNHYVKVLLEWTKREGRDFDFEEERLTGKKDQWVLDGHSGQELIFFLPPEDYLKEMGLSCRIRGYVKGGLAWLKIHWWNLGVANICAVLVVYLKIRYFQKNAK